jgi:hypothetical protein
MCVMIVTAFNAETMCVMIGTGFNAVCESEMGYAVLILMLCV